MLPPKRLFDVLPASCLRLFLLKRHALLYASCRLQRGASGNSFSSAVKRKRVMTSRESIKRLKASYDNEKQVRLP
ncbi:hypothetical protein, partial [uncultured Desulfovibrio sp.]|uniref:hypothetical protein n=1 Tax=uncultured Desulfovibrio sp. TaxID=167968 RepID=UPI002620DB63